MTYSWQDPGLWEDYYKILGLESTATTAQIKSRIRKLAKQFHPDVKVPGETEKEKAAREKKIKAINRAKSTLTNPTEKAAYDAEWKSRYNSSSSNSRSNNSSSGSNRTTGNSSDSTKARSSNTRATGSATEEKTETSSSSKTKDPPPPPPKEYHPILEVDEVEVHKSFNIKEGEGVSFGFTVRHVGGELPPQWKLEVSFSGYFLDDALVIRSPRDSFPMWVSVEIPHMRAGTFDGSLNVFVVPI